jgi:hypothetical protein
VILKVFEDKVSLSRAAAGQVAAAIRGAIGARGGGRELLRLRGLRRLLLEELTVAEGIDWAGGDVSPG